MEQQEKMSDFFLIFPFLSVLYKYGYLAYKCLSVPIDQLAPSEHSRRLNLLELLELELLMLVSHHHTKYVGAGNGAWIHLLEKSIQSS